MAPQRPADGLSEADRTWMLRELELTAERAAEHGLSPAEFVAALDVFSYQFKARLVEKLETSDE